MDNDDNAGTGPDATPPQGDQPDGTQTTATPEATGFAPGELAPSVDDADRVQQMRGDAEAAFSVEEGGDGGDGAVDLTQLEAQAAADGMEDRDEGDGPLIGDPYAAPSEAERTEAREEMRQGLETLAEQAEDAGDMKAAAVIREIEADVLGPEGTQPPSSDPESLERELRQMAAESAEETTPAPTPPKRVPTLEPAVGQDDPDNPEVQQMLSEDLDEAGLDRDERRLEADERAKVSAEAVSSVPAEVTRPIKPPQPNEAHAAFASAVQAHAAALGLDHVEQSSFHKFLNAKTGHKAYVGRTVRTERVRVETTLPVAGLLPGAEAVTEENRNGAIQATLDPAVGSSEELKVVIQLLDMLASDRFGKLPPPRRGAKAQQ